MQIEFIGSTGAGKTTLITALQARLQQTGNGTTAFEVVATPFAMQGVTHPTLRNLIQEVIGFPAFVRSLRQQMPFVTFILKMLRRHGSINFRTLNYLRSLERTVGVYQLLRKGNNEQIVLVDEGAIVLAHNIFVYTDAEYTTKEIAQFAQVVPLADLIIYVRAPIATLIQRTMQRKDAPREIANQNQEIIEKHVKRAVAMFDTLAQEERIHERILVLENPQTTVLEQDVLVEQIIKFIQNH